jgi:hypothetical protein
VLTADNGDCTDSYTITVVVEKATGIADPSAATVTVNGYANEVAVTFSNFTMLDAVTLNIYDITGRKVITQQQIATGNSRHSIKLTDVVTGYYFVVLNGNNYEKAAKVFLSADK